MANVDRAQRVLRHRWLPFVTLIVLALTYAGLALWLIPDNLDEVQAAEPEPESSSRAAVKVNHQGGAPGRPPTTPRSAPRNYSRPARPTGAIQSSVSRGVTSISSPLRPASFVSSIASRVAQLPTPAAPPPPPPPPEVPTPIVPGPVPALPVAAPPAEVVSPEAPETAETPETPEAATEEAPAGNEETAPESPAPEQPEAPGGQPEEPAPSPDGAAPGPDGPPIVNP